MVRSPYPDFYKPNRSVTQDLILNHDENPQISHTSMQNFRETVRDYLDNDFILLGEAHFSAGQLLVEDAYAIKHGKKIGATQILLAREFESSHSGNLQLTTPTQDITYHSGNVNVYGSGGGYGTGSYYGSSTTYGTKTTNVPYTVRRYQVAAAFFCKSNRKLRWGVIFVDPSPEDKKQTGTNKGQKAYAVIKGSPFYKADVMRDDVITKINGHEINPDNIMDNDHPIRKANLLQVELFRKGQKITKTVVISKGANGTTNPITTPKMKLTDKSSLSDQKKQEARRKIIRLYASGAISKEEYDEMIKEIK